MEHIPKVEIGFQFLEAIFRATKEVEELE